MPNLFLTSTDFKYIWFWEVHKGRESPDDQCPPFLAMAEIMARKESTNLRPALGEKSLEHDCMLIISGGH